MNILGDSFIMEKVHSIDLLDKSYIIRNDRRPLPPNKISDGYGNGIIRLTKAEILSMAAIASPDLAHLLLRRQCIGWDAINEGDIIEFGMLGNIPALWFVSGIQYLSDEPYILLMQPFNHESAPTYIDRDKIKSLATYEP